MFNVYLAGPIAEVTPEGATGWREDVAHRFFAHGFRVSSPMRGKQMFKPGARLGLDYAQYGDVVELRAQSILTRDRFDVMHCDLLFANMSELGEAMRADGSNVQIPSIGSDFEFAWAELLNKPIALIAPEGNPYAEHPFTRIANNVVRFTTVDAGVHWVVRNFHIYGEDCTVEHAYDPAYAAAD